MEENRIQFSESGYSGANIKVVGLGGAGGNAVNNMIAEGVTGVEFITANTDMQALNATAAPLPIPSVPTCTRTFYSNLTVRLPTNCK